MELHVGNWTLSISYYRFEIDYEFVVKANIVLFSVLMLKRA